MVIVRYIWDKEGWGLSCKSTQWVWPSKARRWRGTGSEAVQGVSGIFPLDPLFPLPGPASLVHPFFKDVHPHLPHTSACLFLSLLLIPITRGNLIGLTNVYHLCLGRIPGPRRTCYRQMIGYLCCQVPTQAQLAGLKGCNRTKMGGAKKWDVLVIETKPAAELCPSEGAGVQRHWR